MVARPLQRGASRRGRWDGSAGGWRRASRMVSRAICVPGTL